MCGRVGIGVGQCVWKGKYRSVEGVYTSEATRMQTGVCDRLPVEIGVCGGGLGACVGRDRMGWGGVEVGGGGMFTHSLPSSGDCPLVNMLRTGHYIVFTFLQLLYRIAHKEEIPPGVYRHIDNFITGSQQIQSGIGITSSGTTCMVPHICTVSIRHCLAMDVRHK